MLKVCGSALLFVLTLLPGSRAEQDRSLLLDPDAPAFRAAAPERAIVRLETSAGTVDIEVVRAWAPRGADRFVALARHGYYDETRFFRVRPGRWVQFGVNGDPAVARAWRARTFPDDPFVRSNVRHDKEPFTPFGHVVAGMAHMDRINAEHGEGPGGIRAGKQDPFFAGGNTWLLQQFPRLDYIRRATVLPPR
jgi:peptidyl-prolyl cis-trans isomerase A (cyclophilin A)